MDISVIETKVNEMKILSSQYSVIESQVSALDGQTEGSLIVNEQTLEVDGTDFDDLLTALIADLNAELLTIKSSLETLNDEITAEIDA